MPNIPENLEQEVPVIIKVENKEDGEPTLQPHTTSATASSSELLQMSASPIYRDIRAAHLSGSHTESKKDEDCDSKETQANFHYISLRAQKWPFTDPRALKITKYITLMIVQDNLPFSCVAKSGFAKLLAALQPEYTIPSPHYFSNTLIPKLFDLTKRRVARCMETAVEKTVHVTSNVWAAKESKKSFLSLAAHWVSRPPDSIVIGETATAASTSVVCRGSAILGIIPLPEHHSTNTLGESLTEYLAQWFKESDLQVGKIMTNEGTDIVDLIQSYGYEHANCAVHKLNLVVKKGLKDRRNHGIANVMSKCRKICGTFVHSTIKMAALYEFQVLAKVPAKELIQDSKTCWKSTYNMIARLVEQRPAIENLERLHPEIGDQISEQNWNILQDLILVLGPFVEVKDKWCADRATIGDVIPCVCGLSLRLAIIKDAEPSTLLTHQGERLVQCMLTNLGERFDNELRNSTQVFATMLDVRYKKDFLESDQQFWMNSLFDYIEQCVSRRKEKGLHPYTKEAGSYGTPWEQAEAEASSSMNEPDYKNKGVLECFKAKIIRRTAAHQVKVKSVLRQMFDSFFLEPASQDLETDPLDYWVGKLKIWPDLANVALSLLACPPTSVASERVFGASQQSSHPSIRLSALKNGMLTFLRCNFATFADEKVIVNLPLHHMAFPNGDACTIVI
uniref:HAT C-terminal dimerisation domain-containing protein n=1 Tax=Eptatretus burgeri TaxID=7764 RepID=A0A8C4NDP2_EPTBU